MITPFFCRREGEFEPSPSGKSGSHEPSGTIVACGSAATAPGFKPGDRVAAIGWRGLCGKCDDCLGPERDCHYCKFLEGFVGTTLPGAFQEYTVVDERLASGGSAGPWYVFARRLCFLAFVMAFYWCYGCSWNGLPWVSHCHPYFVLRLLPSPNALLALRPRNAVSEDEKPCHCHGHIN